MKQFSKDLGNVSLAPKGRWSKEQEYERLNLVYNDCDNLSYVAKIDVPIGVEIDNREYWQPMNATGYADNNFINLTAENENGTITAYETLEEAVATILPINRRAGATLSFYNLNSDRLDRQAEFELWQFNSTDLANWENRDYWNNIYYNWNVFAGWYVGADGLKNHVKIPNVGQYAYVGTNLNDALLYQCRTNGTWTNTGIKVRNYISVVVSGNITIGENGNWFSDGEDTGIPATPAVDEQLDNIIMRLQQHDAEISNLKKSYANLQNQITSNDTDIVTLNTKHESLSRTVQGIAATGGASIANNVTYDKTNSGLNAENAQDAIDEVSSMVTYDISARNGGVVFESLQALLSSSNLNTLIPTSVRHGGMSIRFVQSSDNKYVQFRYMGTEVTGTPNPFLATTNWYCVDIELVQNIYKTEKNCALLDEDIEFESGLFINSSGQIEAMSGYKTTKYIKVKEGEIYLYSGTFSDVTYYYVWGYTDLNGGGAIGLLKCGTDYSVNPAEITIPSGVKYIRAWGPNWKATLKLKNNLADEISQATSNIASLGTRMSSVENAIPEIIDLFPKKNVIGLETFEEHLSITSESTTFNGFATRYSLNGVIKQIVTNVIFWSPNTCTFTCEIVSGDFSSVLGIASVVLPSSNKTRRVTFNFPTPIIVNGNFYIKLSSTNGFVAVQASEKSDVCTATNEYQNKYRLSSSESWGNSGVGTDGYCIDAAFYVSEPFKVIQDVNIIHIGDFYGADYSEIQPALNAIADTKQPYTLIVHSKVGQYAPFSMIRESFDGTYPWNNSTPKNISIIGIDKEHCIIEAKGGDYYHPAAELLTNGIIKNLTFILSNSEHIAESTQGGYAAHIDSRTIDDVGYKMVIENCKFESETGPAVGVGTHQNTNLSFKDCEFINSADPSYSPISGYTNIANWGAVFTHTSTITDATNQKISFEDCVMYSVLGNQSLRMSVYSTNCTMKLIRNVFWSYAANSPAYSLGTGIVYDAINYGNNIP